MTTNIHDGDTAGSALLTQSDDYNESGAATYTTTGTCPQNCLGSTIDPTNGRWVLSLYDQSVRKISLTADFINGSGTNFGFSGSYSASVEVYVQCWTGSVETGLLGVTLGNPNNNCAFGLDFSSPNGTKYKLEMGQTAVDNGNPATGKATVTCNSGSPCNSWTIVPNPNAPNAMVANLYEFTRKGLVFVSQYKNTYRIDVANP